MKLLKILLVTISSLYLAALLFATLKQRSFMYFPPANEQMSDSVAVINRGLPKHQTTLQKVTLEDGTDIQFLYMSPATHKDPVFVVTLGNAHSNHTREFYSRAFGFRNFGVLIVGYPGYGGNKGHISEQTIYEATRKQIEWLVQDQYVAPSRIALFGQSIGTGPAVQMATEFKVGCLILESPFTSASDLAAIRFPIFPAKYLVWDRFDNLQKIASVQQPTLIYQGEQDAIVPKFMGKDVFAASTAPLKESMWVAGAGHNDLADFQYNDKYVLDIVSDFARAHTSWSAPTK